jgi:hypothetical protein
VSEDLLTIGRLAYAVLIALALITLTVSLFGAVGMMRQINDPRHKSLGNVAASAGVTIVIVAAAVYSGLHMFTFGQLAGTDMFTSIVSAVLAEVTFIAALKRATDTRRGYYVALAIGAIGYALVTNWLEFRSLQAVAGLADPGARAAAVVAFVNGNGLARVASDLYAMAGPMFAAAWGILEYATTRHEAAPTAVTVRRPALRRVAGQVRETRGGLGEIAAALRGERLQIPASQVLAKNETLREALTAPAPTQDGAPFLAQGPAPSKTTPETTTMRRQVRKS